MERGFGRVSEVSRLSLLCASVHARPLAGCVVSMLPAREPPLEYGLTVHSIRTAPTDPDPEEKKTKKVHLLVDERIPWGEGMVIPD